MSIERRQDMDGHLTPRIESLKPWARSLKTGHKFSAGYPFVDVFLVGSGTYSDRPRDIDISAVMTDADFAKHFMDPKKWAKEGDTGRWTKKRWKWSKACTSIWKLGCRVTGKNIDFKIVPMTYHQSQGGASTSISLWF